MSNLEIDILNTSGEKVDSYRLDPEVFDGKVNKKLLYQVILGYLANQRKGTASSKTRAEVRGGGRKPWRQKYTGRARAGSIRSPIWRGGGVVFGPKPRDYSVKLTKKMKRLALKSSLNAKFKDEQLLLLDKLEVEEAKTRMFVKILRNLKLDRVKTLFVLEGVPETLRLSCRNVPYVFVGKAQNVTAYDILNYKKVIFTKDGLEKIIERLKKV